MPQLQPSKLDQLVCLMDSPPILDCSVTPIPALSGSPLQVVAALPRDVRKIIVIDGIGAYVGLYSGDVGQEKLRCIIGSGSYFEIPVQLDYNSRISLRCMSNAAITTGSLCITFHA